MAEAFSTIKEPRVGYSWLLFRIAWSIFEDIKRSYYDDELINVVALELKMFHASLPEQLQLETNQALQQLFDEAEKAAAKVYQKLAKKPSYSAKEAAPIEATRAKLPFYIEAYRLLMKAVEKLGFMYERRLLELGEYVE